MFQKLILEKQKSIVFGIWMLYVLLALVTTFLYKAEITEPRDAYYYLHIAQNISQGRGFLELYNHAYRPPLFPAYLSILFFCGIHSVLTIKIITILVFSSSIILMYLLCKKLFGGSAGLIGALLVTFSPWLILLPSTLLSENLFIPLFLCFLLAAAMALRHKTHMAFMLAGVASGLCTLSREIMLFAPLLLLVVLITDIRRRYAFKAFALFTVFHILIIAPWTLRNYTIFHEFIPVSTNSWINVYIGNNPRYENTYSFKWVIPEGTKWNLREQPDGSDEYDVMVQSRTQALKYIKEDPGAFVDRFCKKAWRFITPHFDLARLLGTNMTLRLAVTLDLAFYTIFLMLYVVYCVQRVFRFAKMEPFLLLTLLFIVYITVVAGITYTNSRYRLPATMIFMVYTTYYGNELLSRLTRTHADSKEA